jgi:DNA replication protein DnaC
MSADPIAALAALGFRASPDSLRAHLATATKGKWSPAKLVLELASLEKRERDARNLAARTRFATLGNVEPLDHFDWSHPRAIDRDLYDELLTLAFLERGENVLLRGQAGVGKSTLAKHLGLAALAAGHSVRFTSLAGALADLLRQETLPAVERRLRRYTTPDLLILDELGYVGCEPDAADLLYAVHEPV